MTRLNGMIRLGIAISGAWLALVLGFSAIEYFLAPPDTCVLFCRAYKPLAPVYDSTHVVDVKHLFDDLIFVKSVVWGRLLTVALVPVVVGWLSACTIRWVRVGYKDA
jgi:hypothetical protein